LAHANFDIPPNKKGEVFGRIARYQRILNVEKNSQAASTTHSLPEIVVLRNNPKNSTSGFARLKKTRVGFLVGGFNPIEKY